VLPDHEADCFPSTTLAEPAPDFRDDGILFREFTGLELGIDQVPVDGDFIAPTGGRFQLQGRNLLLVFSENSGGQTDRTRLVVSSGAIAEMHFHGFPPMSSRDFNVVTIPCQSARQRKGHVLDF